MFDFDDMVFDSVYDLPDEVWDDDFGFYDYD